MKKTILLICLAVITIGCIMYGTRKHMNGKVRFFDNGLIRIDLDSDDVENTGDTNGKVNQIFEQFSAIKINSSVMEVRLEEGDNFSVDGFYTKEWLEPVLAVKNGTLEITQPNKKPKITSGNQNCRINITFPSNTKFGDIDIDTNVGDVKLRKIAADDIHIDLNVGEVTARNVSFNSMHVNTNVGAVSIDPNDDIDEYDMSLSTDVGVVKVGGKGFKRSYNQNGKGKKKIKVNTNVGEINIK